jgi:protein-arginine kinase
MPSNIKSRQWRQNEKIAIARATRLSESLEKIMFVIYDNEEERYDIVDETDLYHLIEEFDLDADIIAEVG